jgi:hypothetical protein
VARRNDRSTESVASSASATTDPLERLVRPGTVFTEVSRGGLCTRWITYRDSRGQWHKISVDHFPANAFAKGGGGCD